MTRSTAAARRARIVAATAVALLAWRGSAGADWLQIKDGSRVETKGAWEVRGAQVVFTLPNGVLAAVRTNAVDLDASASLTAAAKAPPPAATPTPPSKRPILTLTDADLQHVDTVLAPAVATGAAAAQQASPGNPQRTATPTALRVSTWRVEYDAARGGMVLTGALTNDSSEVAFDVEVAVTALDGSGQEVGRTTGTMTPASVAPRSSRAFSALLPGALDVRDARFDLKAKWVGLRPETAAAASQDDATAAPNGLTPVGDAPAAQRVVVTSWQPEKTEGTSGVTVVGQLANHAPEAASDVRLTVTMLDGDGKPLATATALVGAGELQPGASTSFRATFPGLETYENVRFEVRHHALTPVNRTPPGRHPGA